jgi:uncharacterized protein
MQSFHCDTGLIVRHEKTADGFLRVHGRVGTVGPLVYCDVREDGSIDRRTEYVSKDVLFNKASMDSLKMVPLTYPHPKAAVNSENARAHQRGMTGHAVTIDGDFLGVVMTFTDKEAIDAIESGEARELSAGYRATVGKREDGSYVQLSRDYNHVALVPRGRAGSDVRVMFDSADDECWVADGLEVEIEIEEEEPGEEDEETSKEIPNKKSKKPPSPTTRRDMARQFTLGNEVLTVEDKAAADAIASLLSELSILKNDAIASTTANTELAAQVAALTATAAETATKLDAAEGKAVGLELQLAERTDKAEVKTDAKEIAQIKADAEAKIGDEVKARLDAWNEIGDRLPEDFKVDHSLDVPGIYKAFLTAAHPSLNLDGKDAGYIQGIYQGLSIGGSANKANAARSAINESRADGFMKYGKGKKGGSDEESDSEGDMKPKRGRALPGTEAK